MRLTGDRRTGLLLGAQTARPRRRRDPPSASTSSPPPSPTAPPSRRSATSTCPTPRRPLPTVRPTSVTTSWSPDREPALLALEAGGVEDRHARGRVGVQRHVGGRPLASAVDLPVLAEARLCCGGGLVEAATTARAAPAGLGGEGTAAEVQRGAADRDHPG